MSFGRPGEIDYDDPFIGLEHSLEWLKRLRLSFPLVSLFLLLRGEEPSVSSSERFPGRIPSLPAG